MPIIGMLTPLVNSTYNYDRGLATGRNHIGELLWDLSPIATHSYFVVTLLFFAWGVYHRYFRRKTWHAQ